MADGGATAGAAVVSGLIAAEQRRKDRKQAAKLKAAEIESDTGKQKQKAISGVISNFRAALIK